MTEETNIEEILNEASYSESIASAKELMAQYSERVNKNEERYKNFMGFGTQSFKDLGEGRARLAGTINNQAYKDISDWLENVKKSKDLQLELFSGGGLAFAGLAIYDLLTNSDRKVKITIHGMAYSAASIVACAGAPLRMPKGAFMGIHPSSVIMIGTAAELKKEAGEMEKLDRGILSAYRKRAKNLEAMRKIYKDFYKDSLISAEDCKALGLADEVIDDAPAEDKKKDAEPDKKKMKNDNPKTQDYTLADTMIYLRK